MLEYHRAFFGSYRLRVRELVSLSKDNGIVPVLITQPAVFGFGIDDATGIDLVITRVFSSNGAYSWKELELYNYVTREIAAETGVFLVDLGRKLKRPAYIYTIRLISPALEPLPRQNLFSKNCGRICKGPFPKIRPGHVHDPNCAKTRLTRS